MRIKNFQFNYSSLSRNQNGQTLIETLVAAFILVMGISAALGLASYSLKATTNIRQQTVALGLAREGIEVVKNMRDTNWLKGTLTANCHDFLVGSETPEQAQCYRDWLNQAGGYEISEGSHVLDFNIGNALPWSLGPGGSYGLDISDDPSVSGVLYEPGAGDSGFSRKIIVEKEGDDPDEDIDPYTEPFPGPRLKVTSIAWWVSNSCPPNDDAQRGDPCTVVLETYLTNWRNF